eukprot:TRINITY_DN28801_c0_g1_i1.p1 TRINITY_DN28801_c0_g1~~TRINITY_DN28801_c0_g1_i1.p1  ORF type:complete len:383 (+),score=148.77 TRINITY_DN28801_c0_g1_i1:107-1150(+)
MRFSMAKSGISVDKQALDAQLTEKKAIQAKLKEVDDYFARQALEDDKHAVFLHKEQLKEQRQRQREITLHQSTQGKPSTREWDLNDPHMLRKDPLPRIEGVPCAVSSLQQFEGEDPDLMERRRAQAQQNHRWMQQQIAEKNLKKQREQEIDMLNHERTEQLTHKAWSIERSIAANRAEAAKATAEFNKKLAQQKRMENTAAKEHDTMCSLQEIQNMLDSDLLNETNSAQRQALKTLGEEKLADVQITQALQRAEKVERKKQDRIESLAEARNDEQIRRMSIALERARARQRREQMVALGRDRRQQVEEALATKRKAQEEDRLHTATGYSLSLGSSRLGGTTNSAVPT